MQHNPNTPHMWTRSSLHVEWSIRIKTSFFMNLPSSLFNQILGLYTMPNLTFSSDTMLNMVNLLWVWAYNRESRCKHSYKPRWYHSKSIWQKEKAWMIYKMCKLFIIHWCGTNHPKIQIQSTMSLFYISMEWWYKIHEPTVSVNCKVSNCIWPLIKGS